MESSCYWAGSHKLGHSTKCLWRSHICFAAHVGKSQFTAEVEVLSLCAESKPNMPDSTQIDPSHYPSAQLEGMPATAWESASAFAPTAAAPEPDHASAEATLQVLSFSSEADIIIGCN